jgi:hypothetical protein
MLLVKSVMQDQAHGSHPVTSHVAHQATMIRGMKAQPASGEEGCGDRYW